VVLTFQKSDILKLNLMNVRIDAKEWDGEDRIFEVEVGDCYPRRRIHTSRLK
jgi:hypothetical protein